MPDTTPTLSLPYLLPSQAQKHVTHNEALVALDLLVQTALDALEAETPPLAPQPGAAFALGATPTGAWAGYAGQLAHWDGTGWQFQPIPLGLRVWDKAHAALRVWDGAAWALPQGRTDQLEGIGIGTDHDATNRLSVRAPAALFSHDGGGHQIKINKAATGETASILWQSSWSGHAELGLAGNNDFSVKVSADGAGWTEALRVDGASGLLSGAAVQTSAQDATQGRLMRADFGYSPANVVGSVGEAAGLPTGAVIERGDAGGAHFTRFADGTQIAWMRVQVDVAQTEAQTFAFPRPFVGPVAVGFCHATSAPHAGLEPANLRGIAGQAGSDQHWDLRLKTAGISSDPLSESEALILTATGRWF